MKRNLLLSEGFLTSKPAREVMRGIRIGLRITRMRTNVHGGVDPLGFV